MLSALERENIESLATSSTTNQKKNIYAKSILRAFDDLFGSANVTTEIFEEAKIYYAIDQDPEFVKITQDLYIKVKSLTRTQSGLASLQSSKVS